MPSDALNLLPGDLLRSGAETTLSETEEVLHQLEELLKPLTPERRLTLQQKVVEYIDTARPIISPQRFLSEMITDAHTAIIQKMNDGIELTSLEEYLFPLLSETITKVPPPPTNLLQCAELLETYNTDLAVFEQHLCADDENTDELYQSTIEKATRAQIAREIKQELIKDLSVDEFTGGIKLLTEEETHTELVFSLEQALTDSSISPYNERKTLEIIHEFLVRKLVLSIEKTKNHSMMNETQENDYYAEMLATANASRIQVAELVYDPTFPQITSEFLNYLHTAGSVESEHVQKLSREERSAYLTHLAKTIKGIEAIQHNYPL